MSDMSMGGVASVAPQALGMQLGVAMLKKGQEVMEAQGQSMLKLVESMPEPSSGGSLGNNLDVWT